MALSSAVHHSFGKVAADVKYHGLRAHKTDRAGEAANRALRRQKSRAAGDAVLFELFDEDTAGGEAPSSRRTWTAGAGPSGTLWSTLPTSCALLPRCRFSMHLCRRWWNSCWTSCISSTRSRLILSRLSKCPRSCPMMSLCEPLCARSLTILLLVEVFKVFRPGQSPSASSSSPAGVHENADEPGEGFFFRTFPRPKKSDDGNIFREDEESGSFCAQTLLWTSLGHDSGGASDSVSSPVTTAGLGAWFDSGYMVCVSSWVLLGGFACETGAFSFAFRFRIQQRLRQWCPWRRWRRRWRRCGGGGTF